MNIKSPFLIAEISANHDGKITNAKKLIYQAKKYGADAVKLQTYSPDTITLNSKNKYFKIKKGPWKNYFLWDLYKQGQTPLNWHKELFKYAKKLNINIFSTPFDETAVDFLEKLNCPFYKLSSFEITHIPLIKKIASKKKHMIISTGMASLKEIKIAYDTAIKYGAKSVTLLYCVSNYPSDISDFNLTNISIMRKKFNCEVGLSDHSLDNSISSTSVALGARIFEKHIALNKKKGLDAQFSLVGKEILEYKKNLIKIYKLVNNKKFYRSKEELKNKSFRRSIFSSRNIRKGEKFSYDNIKVVRPSNGLEPIYYEKIIGKISKSNIKKFNPIKIKYI